MNLKQQIKELREEIRNCGKTLPASEHYIRVDELRTELMVLEECYEKRIIRGRR